MFERKNYQITMEGSMDMVKVLHMYAQSTLPLAPCSCQAPKRRLVFGVCYVLRRLHKLRVAASKPFVLVSSSKSILIPH